MDEALKTNKLRNSEFFTKYLSGKVIDIGAGRDLVTPRAERFDLEDGDADFITHYREAHAYDAVHSSHCLEHMVDPVNALNEWWSLIKPGGHLVLVVPDEDLYEQGTWPSRFNADHKHTFRLNKKKSWSPVSYDICELVSTLPGAKIVSAEIQDAHYNHKLKASFPLKIQSIPFSVSLLGRIICKVPRLGKFLHEKFEDIRFRFYGVPIDQTLRSAVAQIQIVAQKTAS
jgi:SAM-dependent methyltransferase